MTPDELKQLRREIYETPLDPDEFERELQLFLSEKEEIESQAELCAWFMRRYPTARERLDYARKAYRQWMRSSPV